MQASPRLITLGPGEDRPHDEDQWRRVLIVVESGQIELRCHSGSRTRFGPGAMLWFTGLKLASIHNPGTTPTVLHAHIPAADHWDSP